MMSQQPLTYGVRIEPRARIMCSVSGVYREEMAGRNANVKVSGPGCRTPAEE